MRKGIASAIAVAGLVLAGGGVAAAVALSAPDPIRPAETAPEVIMDSTTVASTATTGQTTTAAVVTPAVVATTKVATTVAHPTTPKAATRTTTTPPRRQVAPLDEPVTSVETPPVMPEPPRPTLCPGNPPHWC